MRSHVTPRTNPSKNQILSFKTQKSSHLHQTWEAKCEWLVCGQRHSRLSVYILYPDLAAGWMAMVGLKLVRRTDLDDTVTTYIGQTHFGSIQVDELAVIPGIPKLHNTQSLARERERESNLASTLELVELAA